MPQSMPQQQGRPAGMPPNLNPMQQQQYMYQQQQQQAESDNKKVQDMIDALSLLANIRDDMSTILDNVGKANSANNYSSILSGRKSTQADPISDLGLKKTSSASAPGVATPSSVSYQQPGSQSQVDQESGTTTVATESTDDYFNMNPEQQSFFENTDCKHLQDKTNEINKNIIGLDRILRELQPVVIKDVPEFIPVLVDQSDNNLAGSKFVNNFRWYNKLQEKISSTSLPLYKRYSTAYNVLKSHKYKQYSIKPIKKEDLEKYMSTNLTNNEIKVVTAQKTENEFVIDIIMPQHFKFVFLLFDCNVERLQVRPLDIRLLKIYSANKPSDEVCSFDFDHKNVSNVLQKLEENCLFACAYFRNEYGIQHFKFILLWIKNYTNLFNAKCIKCEKHLLNGLPPTWRDLKTFEAYHDECRL